MSVKVLSGGGGVARVPGGPGGQQQHLLEPHASQGCCQPQVPGTGSTKWKF